jgi:hypothetical protein
MPALSRHPLVEVKALRELELPVLLGEIRDIAPAAGTKGQSVGSSSSGATPAPRVGGRGFMWTKVQTFSWATSSGARECRTHETRVS